MGTTIYHYTKGKDDRKPGALRKAVNSFKYKQPSKLPLVARHDQLANECHSFGRVFLGAFYDFMTRVFKKQMTKGMQPLDALRYTRDYCGKLVMKASKMSPASPRFYAAIAKTMSGVERQMGGEHQEAFRHVMHHRKILHRKGIVMALSNKKLSDIDLTDNDEIESTDQSTLVKRRDSKIIRLCEHFDARAQADNPLYEVEIEVPNDTYMEFDHRGMMVDGLMPNEKEALDDARNCVHILHSNKMVADGPIEEDVFDKPFSIVEGKLVRNFFI